MCEIKLYKNENMIKKGKVVIMCMGMCKDVQDENTIVCEDGREGKLPILPFLTWHSHLSSLIAVSLTPNMAI